MDGDASRVASPRSRYGDMMASRAAAGDAQWAQAVATIRHADRVRRWTTRCSAVENAMLLGALVSIFTVMLESELMWSAHAAQARAPLKAALSTTSALLVAALAWRYVLVCRIHVETGRLRAGALFVLPSSRLLVPFMLELFVCAFHVPAWVTDQSLRNFQRHPLLRHVTPTAVVLSRVDQLDVIVLARIYLLGRFLRNSVGVQALARRAHVIASFHRVDVDSVWFTVKYLFQKRPLLFSLVALVVDWALTSTALNMLERGGANARLLSANDAIWLTIVTMTSVGYGEIAPETLGGKITIALGAIVGGTVIITCLLRVVLIDSLRFTPQEKLVLDVVYFHKYVRQRKQLSAFLIQRAWRLYTARARGASGKQPKLQVYAAAEALRLLRFSQPASSAVDATASTRSRDHNQGDAFDGAHKTCAALLDTLQRDLSAQRARGLVHLQATAELLRSTAASATA